LLSDLDVDFCGVLTGFEAGLGSAIEGNVILGRHYFSITVEGKRWQRSILQ